MKIIHIATLFLLFSFTLTAQKMSEVFINIPDNYIPQLETEWRKDLVDLYGSDKDARLENLMGGYSELESLTDDYLKLKVTERSSIEMKLLPLINNTKVVCMITTVEGPVADSRVAFFTSDWQPLHAEDLYTPLSKKDFIRNDIDTADDDIQYLLSRLDMDLILYQLQPDNNTLSAVYNTPLYLNRDERKKVATYLKPSPLTFTWNRSQFR